ncbi:hypothetical protein C8Q74DRAFT_485986 [Fomes fomentarius]|nr:hypothetical protein C8Q74DRAFT_485986 [Fomes fomentarius]
MRRRERGRERLMVDMGHSAHSQPRTARRGDCYADVSECALPPSLSLHRTREDADASFLPPIGSSRPSPAVFPPPTPSPSFIPAIHRPPRLHRRPALAPTVPAPPAQPPVPLEPSATTSNGRVSHCQPGWGRRRRSHTLQSRLRARSAQRSNRPQISDLPPISLSSLAPNGRPPAPSARLFRPSASPLRPRFRPELSPVARQPSRFVD